MWNKGTIENTNNPTEMAINGNGFFVVQDGGGANFYTRAGEFYFDRDGNLVNLGGLYVQDYEVTSTNPDGTLVLGAVTHINASAQGSSPPVATGTLSVDVNLASDTAPLGTYATTTTVYDSLGSAIPLTITFTKDALAPNAWTASASVPPTVAAPADVNLSNPNLTFDASGNLNAGAGLPQITINNLLSGATNMTIDW